MGNTGGGLALCWLVLARVKIDSVTALQQRRRDRGLEPIAVKGSVRLIGREEIGAGVSSIRAAYHPDDNTIGLGWFKQIGRWKKPQSSTLGAGDVRCLERGQDLIIAAAFSGEAEARAWLAKRHVYTLPAWEPR